MLFRSEVIGTRAREIGLCIAYDSPLTTVCDWPERYRGAKGVEALRNLPTVWRNTTPISGAIGESYCVAREAFDGRVYLVVLGVQEVPSVEIPLSFLPKDGTWNAALYLDGPKANEDATDLVESRQTVTRDGRLALKIAREGGAVVIFDQKK